MADGKLNANLQDKIPVGISGCLLGEEVRYNGGHKYDAYINGTLSDFFELVSFCPELGAGLGVPRPPIRLVRQAGETRAVGVKDASMDVTDKLRNYAANQQSKLPGLYGFIFKKGSPSCGMERVKLFNEKGAPEPVGRGVFAGYVMEKFPQLPVEEEGRLGDPRLRENFIQRVFVNWVWRSEVLPDISVDKLTRFHARMKLTLMSHDQDESRSLGAMVATARRENLHAVVEEYFPRIMALLKVIATSKNHVNVLQHIQGYLKRDLDAEDKAELVDVIHRYRIGELPLIVPVTLLNHHFRKHPVPYIQASWYMNPYPQSLKLRNRL
ncbi:MAG: YbgA family protein [bacterium]